MDFFLIKIFLCMGIYKKVSDLDHNLDYKNKTILYMYIYIY